MTTLVKHMVRGHVLMFASGFAVGSFVVFVTLLMLPDRSASPSWMSDRSRDFLVSALVDNLDSHDNDIRYYAVWRLGELKGRARSALTALEQMDMRNDEGLGKVRAEAEYKIRSGSIFGL